MLPQPENPLPITITYLPPPCGWLGYCDNYDCDFYYTTLHQIDFSYNSDNDFFIFYVTDECNDLDSGILIPDIYEYLDDIFPWFDGYKPK